MYACLHTWMYLLVCEEGKAGPLVSSQGVNFLVAYDFLDDCELLLL